MADSKIADLQMAIRAVVRADGHDDERKRLIDRARDLHAGGLVPENWRDDGSLKEQRETANDVFTALTGALEDAYDGQFSSWWIWVQDWDGGGDDGYRVIYSLDGDMWAAPFSWVDGKVVVDVAQAGKVRPITTYVERHAPAAHEWRKRKAGSLGGLEHRELPLTNIELREKDEGTWNLTGFACVTGQAYEVGHFQETIRRGAFKRTLSENPDVQLLINHEGLPLARTRSGTLRLEERSVPDEDGRTGLWIDADLDKLDPDAQRLERKMARGDIDGMSFAFQATDQDWNEAYTDRQIKTVSIHRGDVSVVNQGANPAAMAAIRSTEAVLALRRIGPEAFFAALEEWRDHTLLPMDQRAGKALSSASMEVLSRVLELISAADEAVDAAQPLLADLMGVPNPDEPDGDVDGDDDESSDGAARAVILPDYTTRARARVEAIRRVS